MTGEPAPFVECRDDGVVTTVTLARPERRNALGLELSEQLEAAVATALSRDGIRLLVLAAHGAAFCAGADLKEELDDDGRLRRGQSLASAMALLWESPVPVIARVQGSARGGAAGLIAVSDIAVASDDVTFAFPEVRLGAVPAIIAPAILARCDWHRTLDLFLTGETFDARSAADMGLVTKVVAAADLDATVARYGTALLAGAPGSLRITRRLVRDHARPDMREALTAALQTSAAAFGSAEAHAARQATAQGKRPPWTTDAP